MLENLIPRLRGRPDAATESPGDWTRVRAPARDRDRVLQSSTHLWLRSIPTPLHPKQLCRHYPRVANRLADAWADAQRTDELLDELLNDRRGRRRGFPDRIVLELQKLERFHARRPRVGLWARR